MERREIFSKLLTGLTETQEKILMCLEKDNDKKLDLVFIKLNKEMDKLEKIKGVLKLEKNIKKVKKKFCKDIDYLYETKTPSVETIIFHSLLEANDKVNYLLNNRTKLIELTQKRTGVSLEEVEENFSKKIELKPVKFDDTTQKEFEIIDARCSNFLNSVVEYNDFVINPKNVAEILMVQKKTVEITGQKNNKNYKKYSNFLNEIIKVIAVGITILESVETKFTKKEKTQLRYNFTRLKTFALSLLRKLQIVDDCLEKTEFKNVVYRAFYLEGEIPSEEAVGSYVRYLKWVKSKRKFKSELELIFGEVA